MDLKEFEDWLAELWDAMMSGLMIYRELHDSHHRLCQLTTNELAEAEDY